MARTFIGELVLRLKDEMSGKAKVAATNISNSMDGIERAARRLNNATWGGKFQQQLDKLGAGASDLDRLRASWEKLHASIQLRNLGKAAAKSEIENWKLATLGHFAAVKDGMNKHMNDMEKRARLFNNRFSEAMKPFMIMMGGYTGAYIAGVAGREGVIASAAWEREKFRGRMANIPAAEQDNILNESERIGSQYPSVNITDIAEMARSARSMMGDTERGLAILPDLVKGLVTLQSAKGTDAAVGELRNLLRGIDNAGKNSAGEIGINDTRSIIAGLIRAAQIEGADLDVGKLFQFARRGKIAVPGLSTDFLANVSPAFMQDMTPEGFGTALSSAYQAFVIGSNAVASKKNIARQKEIGIRGENGLVDANLFGTNPYAWVKSVLVPALQKQGVDMNDETAVAQQVAQLSRNTNATGLLTRMITQQTQVDRLLEQYGRSMGPDAADEVRFKDPFVAWKGFAESLRNLSAAVGEDTMPTIVAGLNSLANGINSLQQAWRDGDPLAKAGIIGGAAAAGYGTYKFMAAIWGLITAGTNLNAAAVALQAAAVSLGGAGAANTASDMAKKGGWAAGLLPWANSIWPWVAKASLWTSAAATTYNALDAIPHRGAELANKGNPQLSIDMENARRRQAREQPLGFEGGRHRVGTGFGPKPGGQFDAVVKESQDAGQKIQSNLNVTASPQVNLSALQAALALVNQIAGGIARINGASASLSKEMGRNFGDHGVAP